MNDTFTSQAVNFISALQSGVDPCTGQFSVNLLLAQFSANNQLGPELALTLNYSTLSTKNVGFGTGFSLNLSYFNNATNRLYLSNGETHTIEPGSTSIRGKS